MDLGARPPMSTDFNLDGKAHFAPLEIGTIFPFPRETATALSWLLSISLYLSPLLLWSDRFGWKRQPRRRFTGGNSLFPYNNLGGPAVHPFTELYSFGFEDFGHTSPVQTLN